MTDGRELDRAVAHAERAMDEAYSRYAAAPTAQRMNGVAVALRRTLEVAPLPLRRSCLELLADLYEPGAPRLDDRRSAAENALLRAEVERLRQEQETMRTSMAAERIIETLLPPESGCTLDGADPEPEVLAAIVGHLAKFALELTRGFLGNPDQRGAARRDGGDGARFWETIRGDLTGESRDALAKLLAQVKGNVGADLEAFPEAAREGGKFLLAQLDPLVIENEVETEGKKRFLDLQMFRYQRLWEAFQRKHSQLDQEGDLYQEYFVGFLKAARHLLREKRRKTPHA